MAYLMSDVAAGSQAALQLQQNMAAAPNVQQVEANKMQEQQNTLQKQQVQIQQEQATVEKTKLANLVDTYGLQAAQDSKQKLAAIVQTPEFKTGNEVKRLQLISQAQAETNDMNGFVKTTAAIDKAQLNQITTELKQREADGLTIGSAYATIKDASPEAFPSLLEQMSPEQHKAIESQIPNFFKENDPKLQKSQLEALFENTSGKNLLATSQMREELANIQKTIQYEHDRVKEQIAEGKRISGTTDKETKLELSQFNSYYRASSRIDTLNKKELGELEASYKEALKKDQQKTGLFGMFSSASEKASTDKNKFLDLLSTKAWNDLQEKKKEIVEAKLDALEALPEGKEKDRLYDILQKNLQSVTLGPGEKLEQDKPTTSKETTTPTESTSKPYLDSKGNVKPDWKRPDGSTKGPGWLGKQKSNSGKDMSEYSIGTEINGKEVDIPTFVPGLTQKEIDFLKTEPNVKDIPDSIFNKAKTHADKLISAGKSPFKEWDDTSLKEWNKGSKDTSNKYTEQNPAKPTSKNEYDKLPPGSYYMQDGTLKRKKG